MQSYSVIGAGFGDEGKGLVTDFLARRTGAKAVARFNGGGQAGHTVVLPSGQRHVFGHVGAGSFVGAETWLGEKFIVNPLIIAQEVDSLMKLGVHIKRLVTHSNAKVTTVFDMAINAIAELSRGDARHGSCGLGINETVTRDEYVPLRVRDLFDSHENLQSILTKIRKEYVPARLKQLGFTKIPAEFHEKTHNILLDDNFNKHTVILRMSAIQFIRQVDSFEIGRDEFLVLEGAQGLMLDEFLGEFPHVTRSMTGLPNAIELNESIGRLGIQPIYVTRGYLSRHGAGPLGFSDVPVNVDGQRISDSTNVHNQWQGYIRFAPLNLTELKRFIDADLARVQKITAKPVIAVTCMDQLSARVNVVINDKVQEVHREDIPSLISKETGFEIGLISRGPSYNDIEIVSDFGL